MRRALGIFCLVLGVVLLIYQVNDHALPPATPEAPHAAPDPDAEGAPLPVPDTERAGAGPDGAAAAWSPAGPSIPPPPADNVSSIFGGVTDASTGLGVAGASVKLQGTRFSTVTGGNGRFTLDVEGRWTGILRVEASGYRPALQTLDMRGSTPPPFLEFRLRTGAVVSGRVVDDRGGPVAGAQVFASGTRDASVTTDARGNFRMGGLRSDRPVSFTAEADGFLPTSSVSIQPRPGKETTGLTLTFPTPARIRGVVLAFDGSPAVGVEVGTGDRSNIYGGWWTHTDEAGGFDLTPLRGGDHLIRAAARDGSPATRWVRGLPDGGVRDGVELRLGSLIQGQVLTAAGAPVPKATVIVEPVSRVAGQSGGGTFETGPEGWFRIALPYGTDYYLKAVWPRTSVQTPRQQVVLGDRNVVIRLQDPVTIKGEVISPDGRLAPKFTLVFQRSAPRRMFTQRIRGRDGRFRLTDLPPGPCRLSAEADGCWSEPMKLNPAPGEEGKDLRIELQRAGVVHVRVKSARGQSRVADLVLLLPVDEEWEVLSASAGPNGLAVFPQVRPGRYTATARHAFEMDLATHEEFEVTATETKELTINLRD